MQEKLIEILSSAKGWMTAAQIADQGGWRSAANVGVALQQMEKANGSTVRRKSPTVRQGNGMPATEWRHADKHFDGDHIPAAMKMVKAEPVVKPNLTTAKPAPVFTQPAHDIDKRVAIEANLRQQVAHLTDALAGEKSNYARLNTYRDDLKKQLEENNRLLSAAIKRADTMNSVSENWHSLAAEYECKSIPELRVFIGALVERVESLKEQLAGKPVDASLPMDVTTALQFVVKTPSKPPRFTKKHASAHATAMSAARQHGFAEVFALVPVGKAVRGAEWKGA